MNPVCKKIIGSFCLSVGDHVASIPNCREGETIINLHIASNLTCNITRACAWDFGHDPSCLCNSMSMPGDSSSHRLAIEPIAAFPHNLTHTKKHAFQRDQQLRP